MPRFLIAAILLARAALPARAADLPPCREETALAEAAAELLLADAAPSAEALAQAVRRAGSDAVLVRALFTRGESAARSESFIAEARQRADAPIACGIAQSDKAQLMLIAPRAGELLPIERKPVPRVRGRIHVGFTDPKLVVVDAEGGLAHIETSAGELQKGVDLNPEWPQPLRVQLIAKGPAGPRPIAERMLGTPNAFATDVPVDLAPELQLTVVRGEAGARELRSHALLTEVAAAHAKRVCSEGRVAHELAPGEDPERRLRARGVSARRVGETIARERSAGGALQRMLASPAHRLTLLERSFTDVGLGEARDERGRVCLVVLLASWPRFVGR